MTRPHILSAVPVRDWPAVAMAGLVAAGVEIGLRILDLPRLARMAGAPLGTSGAAVAASGRSTNGSPVVTARDRRRIRATRRVMRHWPFGDTCLRQALVSGQRLRHLHPTLQIGVAKVDGEVRAHAWLLIDGVLLDPMGAATSYAPLTPVTGDA